METELDINKLKEIIEQVWAKSNERPLTIFTNQSCMKMYQKEIEYNKKWNVDLFTPKGILFLFNQNIKG